MTLASLRHNDAREVRTLRRARSMSFCSRLALIVGLATLCDATLKPLEASSKLFTARLPPMEPTSTPATWWGFLAVSESITTSLHRLRRPWTPSSPHST